MRSEFSASRQNARLKIGSGGERGVGFKSEYLIYETHFTRGKLTMRKSIAHLRRSKRMEPILTKFNRCYECVTENGLTLWEPNFTIGPVHTPLGQ
jgi:hypothetical protein